MNWGNLKNNDCPKCFAPLKTSGTLLDMEYICSKFCGFKISEIRFNEIVRDRFKPSKKEQGYADHLSQLNNLGMEKVTEDFSDSPVLDN